MEAMKAIRRPQTIMLNINTIKSHMIIPKERNNLHLTNTNIMAFKAGKIKLNMAIRKNHALTKVHTSL